MEYIDIISLELLRFHTSIVRWHSRLAFADVVVRTLSLLKQAQHKHTGPVREEIQLFSV